MNLLRMTFVAFLAAAFAVAQQAPQQPAASPSDPKPIHLEGRVVSLTGAAVRKATVRLQGARPPVTLAAISNVQAPAAYSQTTGDAGQFVFDNVAPGRYTLSADKAGFLPALYGARSEGSPALQLTLAAGDQKKDLDLIMTPQGVITGKVIDQDGDPVANVQVTVARYGYSNGRRTLIPVSTALAAAAGTTPTPAQATAALQTILGGGGQATDDQGSFRINNLPPGRYYVSANPRANQGIAGLIAATGQGGAADATPEATSVTTYYPNALDAQGAVPVDVGAGSEVGGIEIRIRTERVYSIRGKVVDASTGAPVAAAMVMVLPTDAAEVSPASLLSNMSRTGEDGSFEIRNLLPGTYAIQGLTIPGLAGLTLGAAGGRGGAAPAPPPAPATPRATTRIEVGVSTSNVTGAVLQLAEGTEIPGIIKMDEGNLKDFLAPATPQPPSIAGIALPGPANRTILLRNSEGVSLVASRGQFADDGTFKITGVFPAKYFVALGAMPQGTYVKSIRFAGREVARAPLDLSSSTAGSLEVVLSAKVADVSGTVRDEKGDPLQGIPVTLWPKVPDKGRPDSGIHTANTDQNGGFKIAGLAPGDYYVAAWDNIPVEGLNQDPDFLERFQGDDTAVKLAENGHASMDVKLISRERIVAEAAKIP